MKVNQFLASFKKHFPELVRDDILIDFINTKNGVEYSESDLIENLDIQILVQHPFVFDSRKIPIKFKDVEIITAFSESNEKGEPLMPDEFLLDPFNEKIKMSEVNAPSKYIEFLERCENELKTV